MFIALTHDPFEQNISTGTINLMFTLYAKNARTYRPDGLLYVSRIIIQGDDDFQCLYAEKTNVQITTYIGGGEKLVKMSHTTTKRLL